MAFIPFRISRIFKKDDFTPKSGYFGNLRTIRNQETSATLESQFKSFVAEPIVLVEFHFDNELKLVAGKDYRFNTNSYAGKVISIGSIKRTIQRNLGLFEINSLEIVVDDSDRSFSGATGSIKNSIVVIKLGTAKLGLDSYLTIFKGTIDDYTIQDFTVSFIVKDTLINLPEYPITGTVDSVNFPNAFNQHRDLPLPVCYGEHSVISDDDNRNRGAWPTLYVDNTSNAKKFLVACHAVESISEVYCNRPSFGSTLLTLTTDYTVYTAGTINGKTMAWIQFTDAQFTSVVVDTGGVVGEVVCNVRGKIGGSGVAMTNPVEVLRDFLTYYCDQPEIDDASFDNVKNICDFRGYICRGGYTVKNQTANVLRDIAKTFNILIYSTRTNSIAIDLFDITSIVDTDLFDQKRDMFLGSWSINHQNDTEGAEDSTLINSVEYSYGYHVSKQKFFSNSTFINTESVSNYGKKNLILEMPWTGDSATANDVIYRIIFQFKNPVVQANFTTGLRGLLSDVAGQIDVTHENGPEGTVMTERRFQIREQSFDFSSFKTNLRAIDIDQLFDGGFFFDDESLRVRVEDGTASVSNGSGSISFTGATSMITAGVQVNDIIWLDDAVNEGNKLHLKVTGIPDATHITVSNTVWTNESGISYKIMPSWLTASDEQKIHGHLCDETSGEFSNGDDGFRLL